MIRQYILKYFPWLRLLKLFYFERLSDYRMYQPKKSYSQTGEDLLVRNILANLNITKPSYLDIGAYHPVFISNTYLFYKLGGRGVLVEPDKKRLKLFSRKRPGDIFINAGVGSHDETVDYYQLDALSTFSALEKEQMETKGYRFADSIKMKIIGINNILNKYFSDRPLDFVSLDTEGYEMAILSAWDFDRHRPKVICIEAAEHSPNLFLVKKNSDIMNFIQSKNYTLFCDTMTNLIFVDTNIITLEQKK